MTDSHGRESVHASPRRFDILPPERQQRPGYSRQCKFRSAAWTTTSMNRHASDSALEFEQLVRAHNVSRKLARPSDKRDGQRVRFA
jgi:hypothetical protein